MKQFSDEAIIEGLKLRSDYTLNFIYREFFPIIRFLVAENGGTEEDAEDIFQDAILIIYNKISLNQLSMTSSFKTYIYSVCRNIWLQKLNERKFILDKYTDVEEFIDLPKSMFQESKTSEIEMYRLISIQFNSLPEDCQKLLRLSIKNIPLHEIASIMGFKTENYTKTKIFLCKNELKKRIAEDRQIQENLK